LRCVEAQVASPLEADSIDFSDTEFEVPFFAPAFIFPLNANFDRVTFSNTADFGNATFRGYAGFGSVTFSDLALFDSATFSDTATFVNAEMKNIAMGTAVNTALKVRHSAAWLLSLMLSACATGPTLTSMQDKIRAIPPDEGRIWFYRSSSPVGSAMQPSIMLNGGKVGDSVPGGFFYIDTQPGPYVVTTATETDYSVKFVLLAGQERFIRTSVSMGILVGRIAPELVDPDEARKDIANKSYTGSVKTNLQ
jgi:hypothetical protein